MPKTVLEIRAIARRRKTDSLSDLTCREYDVLLFELNRTRYELREQESFIRFYMAVVEGVRECRTAGRQPDEKPYPGPGGASPNAST